MTHKHQCSQGHIWEHGTTRSKGLTPEEWKRSNDAAHTCGVCGETGVFNRLHSEEELERQLLEANETGITMAGKLFRFLVEEYPELEPAELLATVYYFGKTMMEAYKEFKAENRHRSLFARSSGDTSAEAFWKKTFGDSLPNPFTKEGVKHE